MDEIYEDIDLTIEIDEIEKDLKKNKSVAMVGLGDSIGFTTYDYNYLDRLVRSIDFDCNYDVFNGHFLTTSTEEQIEDIILSDISLNDVKNINNAELYLLIQDKLAEKRLPDDKKVIRVAKGILGYKDRTFYKYDEKLSLNDVLKNNNMANVFYSANNNILTKRIPLSFMADEQIQREKNYDHILNMNPNSIIYAIGLVTPNSSNINSDIKDVIKRQNEFYQELSTKYGMAYINVDGLNKYLSREKNRIMLSQDGTGLLTIECIKAMHDKIGSLIDKKNNNQESDKNNGIDYLIEQSEKRIKHFDDQINYYDYYSVKNVFNALCMDKEADRIKVLKKIKEDENKFL